jgi:cell division protein FtsN
MTYIKLEIMKNLTKIISYLSLLAISLFQFYCSSGEYEIDEFKITYNEKTVVADTLKIISDNIKQDKTEITDNIKDNMRESVSFSVQIGAFSMQSNFERFFNIAKQTLGADVFYEYSGNLYKIRIGNFNNRAEAIRYAEFAKTKGYLDAFVITKKK